MSIFTSVSTVTVYVVPEIWPLFYQVTKKYRYPHYNEMLWYVVNGVVQFASGRSHLIETDLAKASQDEVFFFLVNICIYF